MLSVVTLFRLQMAVKPGYRGVKRTRKAPVHSAETVAPIIQSMIPNQEARKLDEERAIKKYCTYPIIDMHNVTVQTL